MDFHVVAGPRLLAEDLSLPCAIGRGGLVGAEAKHEGDGGTPIGRWPMRRVFWRSDKMSEAPETGLETVRIEEDHGWCDAPGHADYNRLIRLPFSASHEKLWREDRVYDVVVELGYNDDPVVPGKGSAIFMHLAKPGFEPTEGCVALEFAALLEVLKRAGPGSAVHVQPPGHGD